MKARVYRNLNTGLWSIQQKQGKTWQVVGHATACILSGVTVRQSEHERQKVIAEQCRSVHCWVEGELIACDQSAQFKDRRPQVCAGLLPNRPMDAYRVVTYNPYIHKTLVYKDDGSEYAGSPYALFTPDQTMMVC